MYFFNAQVVIFNSNLKNNRWEISFKFRCYVLMSMYGSSSALPNPINEKLYDN